MSKRNKIIVSIVGITIVLLALLGLTYAYYLTRIEGNTNSNSISITTADLKLKYEDGSSYINLTNIMPGITTDGEGDNPEPKIFTVTNDGSNDVEYSIGMDEVTNTLTRTQDLTYSITCVEKLITAADTAYTACTNTSSNSGEYPKTNSYLFTNQIKQNYVQKYVVVISYANLDEDQSIDMGSTIKGRMQIYSVPESIDITGIVTGATSGDYVQINSNPKTSVIASDGTYKLIGVEPGNHTLSIKNGNTTKGTKEIVVKQGTDAGINSNTITFTGSKRIVTVNITSIQTNLGVNITGVKNENILLKDVIIDSAQKAALENSTTRTAYSETPLTAPAVEISSVTTYKTTGEEATFSNDMSSMSSYTSNTWYYYDTYEVDTTTGKFTLSGKQSCTYSSCYSNLVGKYLYHTNASNNSNANNHTATTKTNVLNIYKVVEATSSSLKYVQVFRSPNEAERVLVPTTDDYGTSYYYRGDVEDNYVNFSGMCWRIVRIEGDGSIKLILEDMYTECNNPSFTGNWSDGKTYVFGYDGNNRADFYNYTESDGLQYSLKTFQTENLTSTDLEKLKVDEWCYDDKITSTSDTFEYYGAYTRIYTNKKPSLNCSGTKLTKYKDGTNMYVGTLTADEMSFAGAYSNENYNYYLMNNYSKYGSKGLYFWSLSPRHFKVGNGNDYSYGLYSYGYLSANYVNSDYYARPAVSLKSGSVITEGDGTLEKPYIIG